MRGILHNTLYSSFGGSLYSTHRNSLDKELDRTRKMSSSLPHKHHHAQQKKPQVLRKLFDSRPIIVSPLLRLLLRVWQHNHIQQTPYPPPPR